MSQNTQIIEYLKQGKTLTSLEALEKFGCFRLASRINDLKKQGYNIEKSMDYNLKTCKYYACYFLGV